MAKSVADLLAETLAEAGVTRVYGLPGDSLNGFTDAIRRQGKIQWIHVRHDRGSGIRRRCGSAPHWTTHCLCWKLRSRQSAPDQWSL